MKTVVCFITSLSSGGAEHQLVELTSMLVEYFDVSIVTFADVADHYDVDCRVKRIRLGVGQSSSKKLWAIFRYFLTAKVDWVISFGQRENFLSLVPLMLKKRIKVIAGERNFTKDMPQRYEWLLFNVLYYRANYIVPNSYSQKRYILAQKPQFENKLKVITNYTDTNIYKFQDYPNNKVLRIGIFSRYAKQKNCIRFAEAIRLVKEKSCSPFVIEWYGNQDVKGRLNPDFVFFESLVEKYCLTEVLKLNDHVRNVNELMKEFDAICLPSLHEGFSNAISEAICCGKPMLVSDVSDNGIMVKDGENGYLFNPLDVNDIADVIIRFLSLDRNERLKMARRSREIAESLFDKQKFLKGYMDLINS